MTVPYLHLCGDGLSLREDVPQVAGTEDVPQSGGRQESRGAAVIVHVGDGQGGVLHLVVHDGVHEHRHAVFS